MKHILYPRVFKTVSVFGLAFSLLFCTTGCQNTEQGATSDTSVTPPAIITPSYTEGTPDTTDYAALAHAVFEGASVAPAADFDYTCTGDAVTLTAYKGEGGVLVLPDTLEGKPITALGDRLFYGNTAITALSIPDSVVSVGHELLTGCRNVSALSLPYIGSGDAVSEKITYYFSDEEDGSWALPSSLDTVILRGGNRVPAYAFASATRLRIVILPDTIQTIEAFAFANCSQLRSLRLPDSLQTIGEYAFLGCTSLSSMSLRDTVTSIGFGILQNCTALSALEAAYIGPSAEEPQHIGYFFGLESAFWNTNGLPASLKQITLHAETVPNNAFAHCSYVQKITLTHATHIGDRAFEEDTALEYIELPDTLQSIGEYAFAHCSSLAALTFPDTVTHLGLGVCFNCSNLTQISVPKALTALPNETFWGCTNLLSIDLGQCKTIGKAAFYHCVSLQTVVGNPKEIQDYNTNLTELIR